MNAAIAQHLNVAEAAIVRVEEWATVVFAVVRGLGARFISKKVVKMEAVQLKGSEKQVAWATDIISEFNAGLAAHNEYMNGKIEKLEGKGKIDAANERRNELVRVNREASRLAQNQHAEFWIKNFKSVSNIAPSMFGDSVMSVYSYQLMLGLV